MEWYLMLYTCRCATERTDEGLEEKKKYLYELKSSLRAGLKFTRGEMAEVKVGILRVRVRGAVVREAHRALKVSRPQFADGGVLVLDKTGQD